MEDMGPIQEFTEAWNREHEHLKFSVIEDQWTGRPNLIGVRFDPAIYSVGSDPEYWLDLADWIEDESNWLCYVDNQPELAQQGILDIRVSSLKHNYDDDTIIDMLSWLGEMAIPGCQRPS